MTYPLYESQQQLILEVTRLLNKLGKSNDELYGVHLHVELREDDTLRTLGVWSDEIAPDAWYFEMLSKPRDNSTT